ncbi:hypothetical protein SAMN05216559_0147 [Halomicrobium zhouii]|uniref:Uncharacterized protein n=1 Tax=Halomicrobium zhouii TaxID=767519 RepID=A0A1I6K3N9_9EURY|nr:hypothetical protein [Halomicrobium zhouii]SFR85885.1 hypothetical protein SAMN05216559_0147 [Halomicrobium zhouii]
MGTENAWVRTALTAILYVLALAVGSYLLPSDPTSIAPVIPIIAGGILIGHALFTSQLDRMGYALIGFFAVELLLVLLLGAVAVLGVSIPVPAGTDYVIAGCLVVALAVSYFRFGGRSDVSAA